MKNRHAVALSKLGASKGGRARAARLSKARRIEIATLASLAATEARKKRAAEKKKSEERLDTLPE